MSTVTVTPEPEPVAPASVEDAAFAAGQTVGRYESHMAECSQKHALHDAAENSLSVRLAELESTVAATAVVAVGAEATADEAIETAEDAEDAGDEDAVDTTVIEMEMPEVPVESSDKPEKKKGFHLW